jgi:hypothetical protein
MSSRHRRGRSSSVTGPADRWFRARFADRPGYCRSLHACHQLHLGERFGDVINRQRKQLSTTPRRRGMSALLSAGWLSARPFDRAHKFRCRLYSASRYQAGLGPHSALRWFWSSSSAVTFVSIGIGTLHLLESKDPAGPNPRIQIAAMEATAVANLDAGGRDSFFDVAAERLLADGQIGSGAL